MGNALFLGAPNFLEVAGTEATAASEQVGFEASNLLDQEPSSTWHSDSQLPGHTYVSVEINDGETEFSARSFALVNHNLRSKSGYYRFLGGTGFAPNDFEVLPPTGNGSNANATGGFGDVDTGGFNTDGNWITPTNAALAMTVQLTFATPTSNPATGAYKQSFWVYCRTNTAGQGSIGALLLESGVSKATLAEKQITSSTGQWVQFRWNASSLATASGANVEIQLTTNPVAGTWTNVDVGEVIWYVEHTGDLSPADIDSGWIRYEQAMDSGYAFGSIATDQSVPMRSIKYVHDSVQSFPELLMWLSDDHVAENVDDFRLTPPDGYLRGGVLVAGRDFRPNLNPEDFSIEVVDPSAVNRTKGGQTTGARVRPYRRFTVSLEHVPPDDWVDIFQRIDWAKGTVGAFLFSMFPDDTDMSESTTAWVRIVGGGDWKVKNEGDDQHATALRWSRKYVLEEKL